MKFYIMWANHDANHCWNKELSDEYADTVIWRGDVNRERYERVVNRIITKYFKEPNYYKIDGAPVFMIYDINNLVKGLGGIENTKQALEYFRLQTKNAGFPALHLQLTVWGEDAVNLSGFDSSMQGSTKELAAILGFDSVTHYQFVHFTDVCRDYTEILPDVKREWQRIENEYPMPYFPHISIGWDNNPRFKRFRPDIITNNTPENFEKGLEMAKEYADNHPQQPPLVVINSWNEWTESSYLLPDDLNGYGYLDAVKNVFRQK